MERAGLTHVRNPYIAVDATHAGELQKRWALVRSEDHLGPILSYLPRPPARVLDIGAGTGRDALWLAQSGFFVHAVEPAAILRSYTPVHARITSRAGHLPVLGRIPGLFDFILLSAVWHTLPSTLRPSGLACCTRLLATGGHIALSLRRGPGQSASTPEIRSVARDLGLRLQAVQRVPAQQESNRICGVSWDWVVFSRGRQVRDGEASRPFR